MTIPEPGTEPNMVDALVRLHRLTTEISQLLQDICHHYRQNRAETNLSTLLLSKTIALKLGIEEINRRLIQERIHGTPTRPQ